MWTPIAIPVAATAAAATPSKTSTASAASAIPVAAAISAAVVALRAIVADAGRIVARRVVTWREILWRGGVRLRLALVQVADFCGTAFHAGIAFVLLRRSAEFFGRSVIVAVLFARLIQRDRLFMNSARGERLARQRFDKGAARSRGNRGRGSVSMRMAVIVVFEVFENVADLEECVAVQADVDERRLHARKNARYFSFIDAADKREFFFALNVNLD